MDAYWITPKGEILNVGKLHIDEIYHSPEKFGETHDTIKTSYEKAGEPMPYEGKARDEIMTRVIQRGYVRIRERSNDWSIQLWEMNQKTIDFLWQWARFIINSVRDKYADITITTLKNNKMTKTSFKKLIEEKDSKGGIVTLIDIVNTPRNILSENKIIFINDVNKLDDYCKEISKKDYIVMKGR
jgi:hypothetical protein